MDTKKIDRAIYNYKSQSKSLVDNKKINQIESSKLANLVTKSKSVLFRAKTVFPFTLFPDTLIIDRTKITIVHSQFFLSESIISINIEDILNVNINSGPIFSTLTIGGRFFTQNKIVLEYLFKNQAIKAQKIISGLILVKKKGISLKNIPNDKLIPSLKEIGKGIK